MATCESFSCFLLSGCFIPVFQSETLKALPKGGASSLTALTLRCRWADPLPADVLQNLPPVPAKLQYLGYETEDSDYLYKLEARNGKTVATQIPPLRRRGWAWTDQSILDHIGADGWHDIDESPYY